MEKKTETTTRTLKPKPKAPTISPQTQAWRRSRNLGRKPPVGDIQGLYRGYMGIMEGKMETTIVNLPARQRRANVERVSLAPTSGQAEFWCSCRIRASNVAEQLHSSAQYRLLFLASSVLLTLESCSCCCFEGYSAPFVSMLFLSGLRL